VVVTGSRIEEPAERTGSSVTLIPRKEIEAQRAVTVEEALRGVEGVTLESYRGRYDLFTVLTLRGSEPNQTLFLIDGVAINSPYDQRIPMGPLDVNDVDRIEVVLGPQSALYGSEAMGGVVQVITRDGEGPGWTVFGEGGNLETFREGLSYSHPGVPSYRLSYTRFDTDGDSDNTAIHSDQVGATLRWDRGKGSVRASFRYRRTDEEYNILCCALIETADPASPILRFHRDPNAEAVQSWTLYQVSYAAAPFAWMDYRLAAFHSREVVDDRDPPEEEVPGYHPPIFQIHTEGNRDQVELQQNFHLNEKDTLTLLLEYKWEEAEKQEQSNAESFYQGPVEDLPTVRGDRSNRAVALQYLLASFPQDRLTLGYRWDHHSLFGDAFSPRASLSHHVAFFGTLIHAAYGEGIRAPSLEENFGSGRGNPDLHPEENRSYEIGIRQPFPWRKFNVGWTYHRATYRNLILLDVNPDDPTSLRYANVGDAFIQGNDWIFSLTPLRDLSLKANYFTLQTEDRDNQQPLPFRPRRGFHLNLRYLWGEWTFNGDIHRVGASFLPFGFLEDVEGRPLGDTMPAYTRVNVSGSYRIIQGTKEIKLFTRVDNLFDEEISEISGFSLAGRTFLMGAQATF
jgi:vitamin B12 transporter